MIRISCFVVRNSHRRCSLRKGPLRNFAKLTEKHLHQNLFFNKVAGWGLQPRDIDMTNFEKLEGGINSLPAIKFIVPSIQILFDRVQFRKPNIPYNSKVINH